MFCQRCGKEIDSNSTFCSFCGKKIGDMNNKDKTNDKSRKILIGILIGVLTLVVLFCLIIGVLVLGKNRKDKNIANDDIMADKQYDINKNEGMVAEQAATEASGMEEIENVEQNTALTKLLVAVPTESMSLRTSPGLGDDVISELPPDTYLVWEGESSIVNDKEFYKIKVKDTDLTGYVAADFCINVDFEYDMNNLDIVQTSDALYTYDQMVDDISKLCSKYGEMVNYKVIGCSLDGRDIYEVILGNESAQNHVMIQATIHGREYMNTQLIMKMIEYYAHYYDEGTYHGVSYKDLFDKTAFHIVPMSNPDGVTISQFGTQALNDQSYADIIYEAYERDKEYLIYKQDSLGDMTWSDNYKDENFSRDELGDYNYISFDEYQKMWKSNAAGVDLNANFDADWDNIDLKQYPSYGTYKGNSAVSEPETKALRDMALEREYKFFISYHSKGQLIYYDVKGNRPETTVLSENFATLMENNIKFQKVNTNKGYNVNLGGFSDWIQLYLNGMSVTIESGKHQCPLDISEFKSIWLRHRESWAMLAENLY